MSADITVLSATQRLIIDIGSNSVSVVLAGPPGPPNPGGLPPGGTTGQVLKKLSNDDYDYGWVDP